MTCTGCEGKPAPENDPCAVCGLSASPTNTAGLVAEIDAEMEGRQRGYADTRGELLFRCRDTLVTAASAQARIAELEADKAMMGGQLEASRSMLDAEKARADRLATLSTRLSARLCEALERAYVTDAEWVKTEYPNGVSEKLVIDAALQDQPK